MTRPQAQAETLKIALLGAGAGVLTVPGLEVFPIQNNRLETIFLDLDHFQHVIFTSVNSARLGMDKLEEYWPQWPAGVQWYAVGAATAKVMAEHMVQAQLPEEYNSEGLLALPGLQCLTEQKVLIIKGVGGRTLLPDTLKARGAELLFADVYRRACPPVNASMQAQVKTVLDTGAPLVMVLSSIETFDNLEILLAPSWLQLQKKPLVVVSERIAQHARLKGFQNVRVSPKPDDASVISTLEALFA